MVPSELAPWEGFRGGEQFAMGFEGVGERKNVAKVVEETERGVVEV